MDRDTMDPPMGHQVHFAADAETLPKLAQSLIEQLALATFHRQ